LKAQNLQSPWGAVRVSLKDDWLLNVRGESDQSVYFGQGYGAARLRLWQLDLSRRVAAGELAEILGSEALRTDRFQRRLGLRGLAEQALLRDTQAPSAWQARQRRIIEAYIAGINLALSRHARPLESVLLRYRVSPFDVLDAYLIGQLKYFINAAWQYELFHTRLAGRLTGEQHRQLLTTFGDRGGCFPPMPLAGAGDEYAPVVQDALRDALRGLRLLGMASPDTGSNVIVLSGARSATGKPLLASDPHMGHVNPGYILLCELASDEGLHVAGSHFPGLPGIIAGRNQHASWGMVGIMADNQDLCWGRIDLAEGWVETAEGRLPLERRNEKIRDKSGATHELEAFDFAHGRLLSHKNGYGLFLRWPAPIQAGGDLTLHALARCHDWPSFRQSLEHLHNCPTAVGYADVHGDIGIQVAGLYPRRAADVGSLVLDLAEAAYAWKGFIPFAELPSVHNPPEGYAIYANHYYEALFAGKPPLSNRWHSPSRALRAETLINATPKHDLDSLRAIQDDKTDFFAHRLLDFLLPHIEASPLTAWDGDTRNIDKARLLDTWVSHLLNKALAGVLRSGLRSLYVNLWPGWRWNLLEILQHHPATWGIAPAAIGQMIREAHEEALAATANPVRFRVEYPHTIRRPSWLKNLLTGRYAYDGGSRETLHALRQSADFLTGSQLGGEAPGVGKPYTFGPAFKLLCDLGERGECRYMANSPASGLPLKWCLNKVLQRWKKGERKRLFFEKP
jgi:penicillin amidase